MLVPFKGLAISYGEGGGSEVLPPRKGGGRGGVEKVLAMLKGGHNKFWGSFHTVA